MKLTEKIVSITNPCLVITISLFSLTAIAAPNNFCNRYSLGSEHRKVCDQYEGQNVIEMSSNDIINDIVDSADTNKLIIIPTTARNNPFRLTKPLKLASGTSLLADNDGPNGFFDLGWAGDFSIGDDPIYCLIVLGEGSSVTGVRIDSTNMTPANERQYNQFDVQTRAYIYSRGNSGFKVSWASFATPLGLDGAIYADNDLDRNNIAGNTNHIVRYTWIENNGARHGIRIATANTSDSNLIENVEINNNVIKLNRFPNSISSQTGIHTKNGSGSIKSNTIIFGDYSPITSQQRNGITLENQATPTVSGFTMISQSNLPYIGDSAFKFLESDEETLRAYIFSGSIDEKIPPVAATSSGKGILLGDIPQVIEPVFTQTEEQFFNQSSPFADTCPTNPYCSGQLLTRNNFMFTEPYSVQTSDVNNGGLTAGVVITTVSTVVEFAVIAGLVSFIVYGRYHTSEFPSTKF